MDHDNEAAYIKSKLAETERLLALTEESLELVLHCVNVGE